jgi:AraC family transcriptional regulator, regulatory protein of adaptative response / methylated-DNA-[protein]-cysteine methyltransferase
MNTAAATPASDYARIAAAIRYLQERATDQPRLEDVAAHVGLSPFHLQRVFQRWAGISPKRLLQLLTVEHAKTLLGAAAPVLEASLAAGLSGPGRLHDLFVVLEAATPGEYKSGGAGLVIRHGWHDTPFGRALIAVTERGVCGLAFADEDGCGAAATLADLRARWPRAIWIDDTRATSPVVRRLFGCVSHPTTGTPAPAPLAVLVRGTNFQVQVWRALLRIPEGSVTTYEAVAAAVGRPAAVRAAAGAVGDNPVAWLIPCHRVLRKSGALGGYHWGLERKQALLAWEAAQTEARRAG